MFCPAPRSTLFPYTTLFRSLVLPGAIALKLSARLWTVVGFSIAASVLGVVGGVVVSFERRSEEHTSELQSRFDLVCRLLLEKKNIYIIHKYIADNRTPVCVS